MARAPTHQRLLDEDRGGATMALSPTTTAAARRSGGGAYSSKASLDANMVIILGALLCALICALGLNSIIRCALRCGRQLAGLNRHRLHGAGSTHMVGGYQGLKKSIIRQIPVVIYHNKSNDRKNDDKNNNNNNDVISTDCMICLGEFVDGEKIRVLPKCKHGFHVRCIDTWLLSHSSCPTCRQLVSGPEWVVNGRELVAMGTNGGGGSDGSHGSGSQRQVISEMV